VQSEGLTLPTRNYSHTWESPSGPQRGHLFLHAKLKNDVVIRPSTAEEERSFERLDFHDWPLCKKEWQELTAAAVHEIRQQGLDILTTMEKCWEKAYALAFDRIGGWTKKVGLQAFRNKTTRRLLKHLTHLRKALAEMEDGRHGTKAIERAGILCTTAFTGEQERKSMLNEVRERNRAAGYRSDEDSEEEGEEEESTGKECIMTEEEWHKQGIADKAQQIRGRQKVLKGQYDRLIRSMQNTSMKQSAKEKQAKLAMGGERELQMFMGKLGALPTLWGVLPRSKERIYPWVIDTTAEMANRFVQWMGEGFGQALTDGIRQHGGRTFHLRKGDTTIHVFAHSAERWKFGVQPLTSIADFLEAHPPTREGEVKLTTDHGGIGIGAFPTSLGERLAGSTGSLMNPFGDTAEIQVTRGTPQGDALSPSLFVFFMNLCLRHLAGAGVGFVHRCGVKRNNCTFADDVCLIAESIEDMNKLLARVHDFCEWSGMALCLCKCEATGFNFKTEEEENTDRLTLNGATMTPLSARQAFKYLGVRMSLTGSTAEEVSYVKERTMAMSKLIEGHPYTAEQMVSVIQMCAHPVLGYGGPLTNWTFRDLQDVEKQWAVMHKRAWHLTDGHNLAPFLLPQEEGGIQQHTPARIVAKHAVGLAERLAADLDGEMLILMGDEWRQLRKTWGTSKIREVQTAMLLEESMTRPATLLSRVLYLTGLAGITMTWDAIPGMEEAQMEEVRAPDGVPKVMEEQGMMETMYDYMWTCIRAYWRGKGDVDYNRDLAEGVRRLVAAGVTKMRQLQHPDSGEWWVDHSLTRKQHLAVLQALEESVPGTRRHSVAAQLRNEEEHQRCGQTSGQGHELSPTAKPGHWYNKSADEHTAMSWWDRQPWRRNRQSCGGLQRRRIMSLERRRCQ